MEAVNIIPTLHGKIALVEGSPNVRGKSRTDATERSPDNSGFREWSRLWVAVDGPRINECSEGRGGRT